VIFFEIDITFNSVSSSEAENWQRFNKQKNSYDQAAVFIYLKI